MSTRAVPTIWQTFERPILPGWPAFPPGVGDTAFEDGGPTRVQRWFARGGRCQPSERGAAEASRGLLECMS